MIICFLLVDIFLKIYPKNVLNHDKSFNKIGNFYCIKIFIKMIGGLKNLSFNSAKFALFICMFSLI